MIRNASIAVAIASVLFGCSGRDGPTLAGDENIPGYRVSVPGALVGRFPPDPFDVEAEFLIERGWMLAASERGDAIFALDGGAAHLFHLDLNGNLQAVIGRRGGGPGEFLAPQLVRADPRGGVWVSDPSLARQSRFSPEGQLLNEISAFRAATAFTVLPSGALVYPALANDLLAVHAGDEPVVPQLHAADLPAELASDSARFMPPPRLLNAVAEDTVLLINNGSAAKFGAWRVAFDPSHAEIVDIAPLPLPAWLGAMIDMEEEYFVKLSGDADFSEGIYFSNSRVVDRDLWLFPAGGDGIVATSIPLVAGDSASIVLESDADFGCSVRDVIVVDTRLAILCEYELLIYELQRVEPELFLEWWDEYSEMIG